MSAQRWLTDQQSKIDQAAWVIPELGRIPWAEWGERAGLRVGDLDLLRSRLTVQSTLVEATGQPPRSGPPKSRASERTIMVPGFVVDTLAQHLEGCPPVDDMVWTTERGALLRRGSFGR